MLITASVFQLYGVQSLTAHNDCFTCQLTAAKATQDHVEYRHLLSYRATAVFVVIFKTTYCAIKKGFFPDCSSNSSPPEMLFKYGQGGKRNKVLTHTALNIEGFEMWRHVSGWVLAIQITCHTRNPLNPLTLFTCFSSVFSSV